MRQEFILHKASNVYTIFTIYLHCYAYLLYKIQAMLNTNILK